MNEKIYKYLKNFSKNLKMERLARKLTQKQVAEHLGIRTQSYQAYENNVSMPNVVNLLQLSDFFGISIDDLFELDLSKQ